MSSTTKVLSINVTLSASWPGSPLHCAHTRTGWPALRLLIQEPAAAAGHAAADAAAKAFFRCFTCALFEVASAFQTLRGSAGRTINGYNSVCVPIGKLAKRCAISSNNPLSSSVEPAPR